MSKNNTQNDRLIDLNENLLTHNTSCRSLSEILSEEKDAIISNNSDGLLVVLEKKQILLAQIESKQIQINQLIEDEFHIENSSKAILRFINSLIKFGNELASKTLNLWNDFLEQTQVIEQKNLVNGHLLNKQNAKNQLLITLLRGQNPAEPLYGENGKSSKPSYSAHLGQA